VNNYEIKYDPDTCPNHPPASTLKRVWCCECGANKGCGLGDPADGPILIETGTEEEETN
jgi:hypothetical protein